MTSVSSRLQAVQSPVIPVVGSLVRQHPGTISLGQGVVNYGPPAECIETLEKFFSSPGNHKYQLVDGIPELRELIETKLDEENGIRIHEGNALVVTAGANMAFLNAVLAIADPGDEFILQTPYYFNHEMAITMSGCRAVCVPTDSNFQLQIERIKEAIGERTRAVVTVSPNNPTGAVYPESDLRAINELCRRTGTFHIHDEAYEYFVHGNIDHFSPGSIPDCEAHTISLFSLSKAYGFASWRVGYQVVPIELLHSIKKIQDTNIICPPVVSQHVAAKALDIGRAYCGKHLQSLRRTRDTVSQQLAGISDICETVPTDGAFYFFLRLACSQPPITVVEHLIKDHGVAAIPGDAFGYEEGCAIRVSYGALAPDLAEQGIQRLTSGLRQILT